ncbi:hypothetical protein CEXT_308161 [Caerostris extrusa]|uniref:Uncharacterized protein n=1 Tax=Caerostris extrusa TaxID=172846 RepID=A0AAV4PST9_CAEEX|nr:hypothetical protein CEXT_308161 [Caerostris extrusa]
MSRGPLSRNSAESDESSLMRFLRHKKLLDKSNLTEEERVKAKLKGRRRRQEGTENYIYSEGFCRRWKKLIKDERSWWFGTGVMAQCYFFTPFYNSF